MIDEEADIGKLMSLRVQYVMRLTELNAEILKHQQIHCGLQVDELGHLQNGNETLNDNESSDELEGVIQEQLNVEQALISTEEEIFRIEEEVRLIDVRIEELSSND